VTQKDNWLQASWARNQRPEEVDLSVRLLIASEQDLWLDPGRSSKEIPPPERIPDIVIVELQFA